MNETEYIFYTIGFFGVGYSLAHLFKTMATTWQERPFYLFIYGIPAFLMVLITTTILEPLNNIFITLCFLSGFIFRFSR
jgi:predicted membrane channel-forming protein YqfA (hemolysin III family)